MIKRTLAILLILTSAAFAVDVKPFTAMANPHSVVFAIAVKGLTSTAKAAEMKPFTAMANTTEWVHAIDDKDDIRQFNNSLYGKDDWFGMLNRQNPVWVETKTKDLLSVAELQQINTTINNSIKTQFDMQTWNKKDYTATPEEIKSKGAGDCKAFVTLKYFKLASLGYANQDMNVYNGYYVKGLKVPIAHRVLVVKSKEGLEIVMDIMSDNVHLASDYMNTDFMPKHRMDSKRVSIW